MRRQRNRNSKAERLHLRRPLADKAAFDLTAIEFDQLLDDLCVDLGFCISGSASRKLWDSSPETVDAFVAVVCRRGSVIHERTPAH